MQRDEQRRRTREALLTAAAHEFELRGFAGTSLAHVADRLGLVRTTVHFHFATKERLAQELVDTVNAEWLALIETLAPAGDGRGRLRAALTEVVARWLADPRVRAAHRLINEHCAPGPSRQAWVAFVRDALADGAADGSIRADILSSDAPALVAMARGVLREADPAAGREQSVLVRLVALTDALLAPSVA